MQINSLLLYIFAKNIKFGPDVASSIKRSQTLAIIYIYLASICKVGLFETSLWLILPDASPPFLIYFALLCASFGFLCLRNGKPNASVAIMLTYMHLGSLTVSCVGHHPVAAFYCLYPIVIVGFFLTSSAVIRILNLFCCFLQVLNNLSRYTVINGGALSSEEFQSFSTVVVSSFTSLLLTGAACYVQRLVEANIIEVAEFNHRKSENVSKELFQVADNQEKLVSLLINETSNRIAHVCQGVDNLCALRTTITDSKIARAVKSQSEFLMKLLNDFADVAKLKSNATAAIKKEECDINQIIKKVFTMNSENFKAARIYVGAFVDKNVPQTLWIDTGKMTKVLNNIISHFLSQKLPKRAIIFHISWYSSRHRVDEILSCSRNISGSEKLIDSTACGQRQHDDGEMVSEEFTFDEKENHDNKIKTVREFKVNSLEHSLLNQTLSSSSGEAENWEISQILDNAVQSLACENYPNCQTEGFLKIQVLDAEGLIPQKELVKLFGVSSTRNVQIDPPQNETDLGLWVSRKICQQLGGDLTVSTEDDGGFAFRFCIPVDNSAIALKRSHRAKKCPNKIKALVADGSAFSRDLHKLLLEKEGVHVTLASDGCEVLNKFMNKGDDWYDFILTDIGMPNVDGFSAVSKIRDWEVENNQEPVDVYFLTGDYFNEEDIMTQFRIQTAKDTHRIHCMKKPVDITMLRKIVQKYKKIQYNNSA